MPLFPYAAMFRRLSIGSALRLSKATDKLRCENAGMTVLPPILPGNGRRIDTPLSLKRRATLESTLEPLFTLRKHGHAINFYQESEERGAHGRPGGRVMVKKLLVDLVKLLKAR